MAHLSVKLNPSSRKNVSIYFLLNKFIWRAARFLLKITTCAISLFALPQYSQKLDISALTSVTNVYPDENGSAQFILMLSNGELELKVKRGKL